ncbi:MAG TPA: alpha/beta hydrolase-fold protein, partial [bacterium]|nr:alpha/beta hydrolase-fold protein [bacterium]
MKKYLMWVLFGLIGFGVFGRPAVIAGQSGRVVEGLKMESALLGEEVDYTIYLPPGYDDSDRYYPVVYLLHGYTDEEWAWIQFGEVRLAADRAIADRTIPPMVIVMPDGGVTWYINDYNKEYPFEDMFVREFLPFIEETYRIRSEKEFRGISGLSMGGYGALMYSMRYYRLFTACA